MNKKIIIILIITILIILFIILGLKIFQKMYINKSAELDVIDDYGNYEDYFKSEYKGEKQFLKIDFEKENKYYAISSIATEFIENLAKANGYYNNQSEEDSMQEGINYIYNVLDEKYKDEYNITENNIKNKIKEITEFDYNIDDIYISELDEDEIGYNLFIVEGTLNNNRYDIMINIDSYNMTYSVFLNDYMEKYGYKSEMNVDDIKIGMDEIKENNYNTFNYENVTNQYVAIKTFEKYMYYMKNNVDKAYEKLDDEYKQKRFETKEDFIKYISDINIDLEDAEVNKFAFENLDDTRKITCIDQYNNKYIFTETSVMDFKVQLDDYTLQTDELKQKYNDYNTKTKVAYNINKFITMSNTKDYKNMYKLLSEGFRNNNFQTEEDFENYIRENLFDKCKIEFKDFSNEGEIYIYSIVLSDYNEENSEVKNMSIIMQLNDDMDFELSFKFSE